MAINKVDGKENPADVMTKPLDFEAHWSHLQRIGIGFLPMVDYSVEMAEDDDCDPDAGSDDEAYRPPEPEGEEQVKKQIGAFAAALLRAELQ